MTKQIIYIVMTMSIILLSGCSDKDQSSSKVALSALPLINPNTATVGTLSGVKGLSTVGVKEIVAGRPFSSPTQLHAALSQVMSADELKKVYDVMFVKVNLNTAAEADLKLIPSSMSPGKLAHEIDEYRPYADIEQFRREIGKYVNAKEVEHLERYVTIN